MLKKTKADISFFQSEKMVEHTDINHFFSTRNSGVSTGVFKSLNFGTHHGEEENMKTNLLRLAGALNLNAEKFVIPKQTHNDIIGVVDESNYSSVFENTDSIITNVPSIILAIKTADCVPVLLYDPIKKVIGAVHSGWRGTAQNIVGKTIDTMNKAYGSHPSNIIAAIGPCISSKNYEVGIEVVQKIERVMPIQKSVFNYENTSKGRAFLDLSLVIFHLLLHSGLKEINIDTSCLCTFSMKDDFFSARRDGIITGRMINGISLNQ